MPKSSTSQLRMAKDTLILLVAKILEGVIGFITLSQYTFLFSTPAYGTYSIINITVNASAMIAIQWLSQSAFRYVNDFERRGEQETFYATAFTSWLVLNGGAACLAILLYGGIGATGLMPAFFTQFTPALLALSILAFIAFNTAQVTYMLLLAKRMTTTFMTLTVSSVTGKLLLLIALVKIFHSHIEWILLANLIFDGTVAIVSVIRLHIGKFLKWRASSKTVFRVFWLFGFPLIGNVITTNVLNNADKYFIGAFIDAGAVAVYTANYSAIASVFTSLSAAIMRGTYPTVLRVWNEGDEAQAKRLISQTARMYMLVTVPAVAGVWAICRPLAQVLFEKSYVDGAIVMPWVALGYTFLGLTEYSNKAWELGQKTRMIFQNSLVGALVNIALNALLIPFFGYKIAAVTTAVGFFVYFLLSKLLSLKFNRWKLGILTYARIFGCAGAMALAVWGFFHFIHPSLWAIGAAVILALAVYAGGLLVTGELRNEWRVIWAQLPLPGRKRKDS